MCLQHLVDEMRWAPPPSDFWCFLERAWGGREEEVAFGGWGGVGELEDVYPLPEALQQEPGTQMYKAARLVCSSMRQAGWATVGQVETWFSRATCALPNSGGFKYQPIFRGLIFQEKQESKLLCEISWPLNLKKYFTLHRLNRSSFS